MTNSEINDIEQRIGLKLPSVYVETMTSPEASQQENSFWYRGLFNDAEVVIGRTIWARNMLLETDTPWQPTYVVVSEINGGDAVILDAAGPDELLVWDHETNQIRRFVSLVEFSRSN